MVGQVPAGGADAMSDRIRGIKEAAEDSAREYAWKWFEYHANQRQSVFRFYIVIVGASSAVYVAFMSSDELRPLVFLLGIPFSILSFLFWRLDVRGAALVKLSEYYLEKEEVRLEKILGAPEICLINLSNQKKNDGYFLRFVCSFTQVYRVIFMLGLLSGLSLFFLTPKVQS